MKRRRNLWNWFTLFRLWIRGELWWKRRWTFRFYNNGQTSW